MSKSLGAIQNCFEVCVTDPVPIHFGHTSSASPAGVVLLPTAALSWRESCTGSLFSGSITWMRHTHRILYATKLVSLSINMPSSKVSPAPGNAAVNTLEAENESLRKQEGGADAKSRRGGQFRDPGEVCDAL